MAGHYLLNDSTATGMGFPMIADFTDGAYVYIQSVSAGANITLYCSPIEPATGYWMPITSWYIPEDSIVTAQIQGFYPFVAASIDSFSGGQVRSGSVTMIYTPKHLVQA